MKEKIITVTEAARSFSDCINRAHYQNTTFVLVKNGIPFARLTPAHGRHCTGRDLAEALAETGLSAEEARAWRRDIQTANKNLKAPGDRWQ
jgi:hypothetical protein